MRVRCICRRCRRRCRGTGGSRMSHNICSNRYEPHENASRYSRRHGMSHVFHCTFPCQTCALNSASNLLLRIFPYPPPSFVKFNSKHNAGLTLTILYAIPIASLLFASHAAHRFASEIYARAYATVCVIRA